MNPLQAALCLTIATPAVSTTSADDSFPVTADDVQAALFAEQPLVRNPCAITFDALGRLCVGMGPQYRNPKPDTPGDSVWVFHDHDRDGTADARTEFATGFNNIQGLAWNGPDLYVANAPELTVVTDTDGDGVADRYTRLYTDLGNLEHGLHGLQFGPDGRLYMSKGNSKGLTQLPDRLAPAPFLDLWGVTVPAGTPEFPEPVTTGPDGYQKNYHDPRDDWGVTGGVLRCNPDGTGLEIVSRGFRNPWDIAFDHTFDWLGTDNDQTYGDKIFAPFFGAHFGWGHPWSYDWKGDDHLPSAPSSGPLFEGSGTGVIFAEIAGYPDHYRGVFFINDWLNRETLVYRPAWDGARRVPATVPLPRFAHAAGGRSMPKSDGRAFDPVDIELGPDGALWVSSWGRQYGAHYEDGKLANEGRIYRLWPKAFSPDLSIAEKRARPLASWSTADLLADLGSHLPAWRTAARNEFVRRGAAVAPALTKALNDPSTPLALETWAHWALAAVAPDQAWRTGTQNQHLQSLRIQAASGSAPHPGVRETLSHDDPRLRLAAVLAVRQTGHKDWVPDLLERAEHDTDRLVAYATWGALMDLLSTGQLKKLLADPRPPVRRAGLLALLEQDALTDDEIKPLTDDADPTNAALATKCLAGKAIFEARGRPLTASGDVASNLPAPAATVGALANPRASSGRDYRVAALLPGAKVYTDRPYRILKVPALLEGQLFLQTACSDADPESGITVTVDLPYPATLYLADDARAEQLPAWARGQWEPTDLTIETQDPRQMRLYRREVPVGQVTLGTNRDGVRARKGNYILVAFPKLLAPSGERTTLESALAKLPEASPDRGRDLFFSRQGANCAACHRLHGSGNNFAPDLADIGNRADAEFLVTSVIDPSAAITEGFAAQSLTTESGATYTGIIIAETGRQITLAMTGGATVTVDRADVKDREGLHISAMPPGFDVMLTPLQVADLTAFLLAQKQPAAPGSAGGDDGAFSFARDGDALHLDLGSTRIATYLTSHPQLPRRALVNVHTPSGIPVTRPFPAPDTEDHALMHPGIWMSFGWLSGNDYWRFGSKVRFDKFLTEPKADGTTATFATRNHYLDKAGAETVCTQDGTYTFTRTAHGVRLDLDTTFFNDGRGFEFGDQEEGGLAVRLPKPLTVQHGNGRILNDRGDRDGKGTWGNPFRWIDYSGTVGDRRAGLLVVPHPDNPGNVWAHSRDYGALVANPFPRQPKERRAPYVTTPVRKGERFRLRYTVHIIDTPAATYTPQAVFGDKP